MELRNFIRILARRNILTNSRVVICVVSISIFPFFDEQLSNESTVKNIHCLALAQQIIHNTTSRTPTPRQKRILLCNPLENNWKHFIIVRESWTIVSK